MASKELTDLIQAAGAEGDGLVGLSATGALVRRDSVPYDKDAAPVACGATDVFIGVSVSGEARTFNAIPYDGPSAVAATPAVSDLVVGRTAAGDARVFTVASLATTLEGASFGSAAFVNTGTAAGEVPLNSDLGSAAYLDVATTGEAEAGTAGVIPDSAGVHAAIAAVGYRPDNETLIYDGPGIMSYDLDDAVGGYPGDGWYRVYFNAIASYMTVYVNKLNSSRGTSDYYLFEGTLTIYSLYSSAGGVIRAESLEINSDHSGTSLGTVNFSKIYKLG